MRVYVPGWSIAAVTILCGGLLIAAQLAVFLSVARDADTHLIAAGEPLRESAQSEATSWIYGNAGARFTLIEYADLECLYCASSFPELRRWIDAHPDVSWQWRHLPLPIHDPTATRAARITECTGAIEGNDAFWKAVERHYARLRSSAYEHRPHPKHAAPTGALSECLSSGRADRVIELHRVEAAQVGIEATPTIVLRDVQSGNSITLQGAPSGDVLLSALDALILL